MKVVFASAACAAVLTLALSTGAQVQPRPDDWTERDVRIVLGTTEGVDVENLEIQTVDGNVTLKGFVSSLDEKQRAGDVAAAVVGVREVQNELTVSRVTKKP